MMNPYRMKALEGLLDYLSGLQGADLKSLLDESQKPTEGLPLEEEDPTTLDGTPKGLAIEKVSILGKPKVDDPMSAPPEMPEEMNATDDELDELYKKFSKRG